MPELTLIDYLYIVSVCAFFNWAIATFIFNRITVRFIDKSIKAAGETCAEWDKGVGMRVVLYAMTIVQKKAQEVSLINEDLVKKYARKKDTTLAWYYCLSSVAFFALMFSMYFIIE
ncbi:hypothetical protein [Psychromonas sp. Urea-02u-13]|uniref:hypothetical protein n=1 Tax=Psychromonas sp. Urea-02u-13 TaxID=2058326 RepID=UPI000C32AF32|nr:hypothetical protein [Psychromonas sp. Urea-02u-13]PKG38916.1 hypothetical protein CXF74_11200 [Psychromonas sp. Urea-02u-13]